MLTAKQEKFVRNLIEGMTQREAYKNSYNATNMTDKTIDEKACLLFADDKIKARYQELQDRLANASIMTAQERLEYLTEVIKGIQKEHKYVVDASGTPVDVLVDIDTGTRLKAVDLMNKMQGEYVQKVEANVDSTVNITIELED